MVDLARYLGLDTETFADDLDHPDTQAELAGQIALTQAYGVKGFPTLLLETSDNRTFIDINPNDSQGILNQMGAG